MNINPLEMADFNDKVDIISMFMPQTLLSDILLQSLVAHVNCSYINLICLCYVISNEDTFLEDFLHFFEILMKHFLVTTYVVLFFIAGWNFQTHNSVLSAAKKLIVCLFMCFVHLIFKCDFSEFMIKIR